MEQEKVWDFIADSWKDFRSKMPGEVHNYLIKRSGKILDVGCGGGRTLLNKKDISWTCVDFSKEMLKNAKKKAEELEIEADFKKVNSSKLPFDDSSFDHVLLYSVLHCVETEKNRKKTLEEIHRVLKPKGTMLISVWGSNAPRINGRTGEMKVPWEQGKEKVERYTYIYTKDELKNLLEETGFEIEQDFEDNNIGFVVRKR